MKNLYEMLGISDFVLSKEKIKDLKQRYIRFLIFNSLDNSIVDVEAPKKYSMDFHFYMIEVDFSFVVESLEKYRTETFCPEQILLGLFCVYRFNKDYFEDIFGSIVLTPDDAQKFMSIVKRETGGEGGRCVKRNVAAFLNKCDVYSLIKYSQNKMEYSLGDLVVCSHPKPKDNEHRNVFCFLRKLDFDYKSLYDGYKYMRFLRATSSKSKAAVIKKYCIPYDLISFSLKSNYDVWVELLPSMSAENVVDNIVKMERDGVLNNPELTNFIIDKINNCCDLGLIEMVDALKIENNEIKTIFLNKIKENILSDCDFFGNISVIVENDDETQLRQEMHCVLTIINDIYGNVEFRNKNKELNKIFFNKNEIFISGDSVNFICGTAEVFQMSGLSKKHYNIIRYIKDRVGDDS